MAYTVEFAAQALEQLTALYRYIATAASPLIAKRYTDAIVTHCEELRTFRTGVICATIFAQVCVSPITASVLSSLLPLRQNRSTSLAFIMVARTLSQPCNFQQDD
ncbi:MULTISPECIES: type II toxin-antitoxin system RelE/ParE family toxin [Pseudomonas]|uniref:type II toxin-antitoxin system RelE/ParE family toxin n=1 Tax=Pseudomonas TaxID=286 RepID=UPI00211C7C16|nr:type II toxin-antitoxin system RelE/ParE family toxin [Pseudomonas fragi]